MFMALVIIMLLMTISVAVIAIQASDNRIIDLYGRRVSNIFGALNLSRSLPDGMVGQEDYEGYLTATGGDRNYAFSIVLGTLPPGLTLNSITGLINGTPTAAGTYPFIARVTDGTGRYCERELRITITGEPLEPLVLGELIPDTGFVGQVYTGQIAATGGDGNYTFSIVEGALPGGLAMDGSIGDITGTPTTVGTYNFTIRVVDGSGGVGQRDYQLIIQTFAEYVLTNNLYVFGNEVKIDGSSTISGEEATVVVRDGFEPGSSLLCFIATKNIYIEGNVNAQNFELGIPGGRSSVYIDGNIAFSGGSKDRPRIHGDLYCTGTVSYASYLDSSIITHTVNYVTSIPVPNFPIPPVKADQWYQNKGYTSNTTPHDNMKYYGDSYTFPTWETFDNVIVVAKTGNIKLPDDVHCTGNGILFAPNGNVIVAGSSTFTGIIVAKRVEVTGDAHVTFKQPTLGAEDLPF